MSTTIAKQKSKSSTGDVENYVYHPPTLTKSGAELVSDVSLVAVADLRPVTLGERIRRYMRTPQFMEDINDLRNNLDLFDPEEIDFVLDPHENPMSDYEDRMADLKKRFHDRKQKLAEEEKQKLIKKEAEEKEAFKRRYDELRREGSSPPGS